jgi:A/G-specific adenine glycosylase
MGSIPPARAAAIRRRLLAWWDVAQRSLPWRFPQGKADPYAVWISEVMLQQTQVATVIPYYHRFLARFPTLQALAAADEEQLLGAWSGLGYYSRARALHRAARETFARHGGLPASLEALRELPGFGPYTAGAVASIAFGLRAAAVDGNAGRVLSRLFLVEDEPQTGAFRQRVWALSEALVGVGRAASPQERDRPGDLNQALIELGALICRPTVPLCPRCPLEPLCGARRSGRERSLPKARRRPHRRRLRLGVGICVSRGRVLLVRRPARGLFAGMWAPPMVELGAGVEPGLSISGAIERELSAKADEFVDRGTVERILTHRVLELRVFAGRLKRPPPPSTEGWRLAWPRELGKLPIPEAMRRVLAQASAKDWGRGVGSRTEKG